MKSAEDLALLAEIVASGAPSQERLARVGDWQLVLDRAARFMILPTVADALVRRALPADVDAMLAVERANTAARNALLLADLALACEALNAAAVPFVVAKGGAMLLASIIAPAARHLEDVDLIVAEDALDGAIAALERAGFRFTRHLDYDGTIARDAEAPGWGPHGTLLELHPSRALPEALATSVGVRVREGVTAQIPARAALLEQLSHHVLVHHASAPLYLARHLADVRALAGADIHATGAASRLSIALHAAVTRSPRLWARLLFPSGLQLRAQTALAENAARLASLPRTLAHPLRLLRRIFPDRAYLVEHYGRASAVTYLARFTRRRAQR